VSLDPAFRALMMYPPALQLAHDLFGPSFQLNQSNFISRVKQEGAERDFAASIDWHADGPRPKQLPSVETPQGPAMGLHYFKLGYFLTDVPSDGGPLKVVRGSHKRPELDGKPHADFHEADYADDVVTFACEAGTVVAFHQALWHAAAPNEAGVERKNLYISYCPTWMKPLDYDLPREGELDEGLSDEARFLLGEYRPPLRFWLADADDRRRLARFGRD
jgi:ectoine hydroxylase-related dioxygenase (phytanoyl-CoA dioxygenase family)